MTNHEVWDVEDLIFESHFLTSPKVDLEESTGRHNSLCVRTFCVVLIYIADIY